jgi:phosphoglycerate dehydrogenase-like enzyme
MTDHAPEATIAVNLPNVGGMVDRVQERFGEREVVVAADDERASGVEIVAAFTHDRESLRRSVTPSVKWIHAFSTGVDGFPCDLVGDRVFTCSRGAGAVPIAEWVLAMILAHAKRLPESWIAAPPERWNAADLDVLERRTVGLVGIGAIGTEVARRALAFDMDVVAYRRRAAAAPLEGVEVLTSLPELLARSDHVVVAAPATPATFHLIDADALAAVKPGAHLVNIARGTLVDQDALVAALDRGQLSGASLDTVDPEPLPEGHPLYAHPKVRVSPHISWSAPGTLERTLGIFVDNVARYRAGEPLTGVVDLDAGY